MRILAMLLVVISCAAAVPVPQFVPRPHFVPRPDALPAPALVRATAPPQSAGAGSAAGMTKEEAEAIDARALERYGWKLCQGSCGMVCVSHGGGLRWMLLGPGDSPDKGNAGKSPEPPPRRGHFETRTVNCGPFGQQRSSGRFTKEIQVWVDDPPERRRILNPTPLPWHRDGECICDPHNNVVARLDEPMDVDITSPELEANGDLIVRACNSHAALVAAWKENDVTLLISERDCGCTVREAGRLSSTYYIEYCPLHAAAPALLEACRAAAPLGRNGPIDHAIACARAQNEHKLAGALTVLSNRLRSALALAEPCAPGSERP
jgi:hypothetical protein